VVAIRTNLSTINYGAKEYKIIVITKNVIIMDAVAVIVCWLTLYAGGVYALFTGQMPEGIFETLFFFMKAQNRDAVPYCKFKKGRPYVRVTPG